MEGERSSLITEAIRLVHECRPRVFIWENVKGTFSSNNGADFWAIIQAFANIGGYRLEWQLLNTSWFLPQNRERIYLVGYSTTTKRNWRGVFPIGSESKKNTNLPRQQGNTCTLTTRYGADGNGSYVTERKQYAQEIKVKSATSKEAVVEPTTCRGGLQKNAAHFEEKSPALTSAMGMGGGHTPIVVQPNYSSKALNETIENNELVEGKPKALDLYNRSARDESPTLTEPHHNTLRMFDGYRIRRLTPIECERLQGFPDNHTEYGNYDGEVKKMSNTQRYKQCGNAVTVDVVQAIANKLHPLFQ
jgi:DNA (cytosine-5)-methyltransferase 1